MPKIINEETGEEIQMSPAAVEALMQEFFERQVDVLARLSYRLPATHMPWKQLQGWFAEFTKAAHSTARLGIKLPGPEEHLAVAGTRMMSHDFPFFLMGQGLFDELSQTDALTDLNIHTDAPLPFPAFAVIPPTGALRLTSSRPEEGAYEVLAVSVTEADRDDTLLSAVLIIEPDGVMSTRTYCLPVDERGRLAVTDGDLWQGLRRIAAKDGSVITEDRERWGDLWQIAQLSRFVSNTLAAMAAEPELVDDFSVQSTVKKAGKVVKEFRSPRWVGRSVERWRDPSIPPGGGSVSPHWRRGFVRRQHFGKGNLQTKIVRIKPVRVNSKKEAEAQPEDN